MPPDEPRLLLSRPGARVLVVGSGGHIAGSRLPDIPAVPDTVADLGRCLVERAGLDPAHLDVVLDPADPRAFGDALVRTAAAARDVFVLHFAARRDEPAAASPTSSSRRPSRACSC
ncbi:hypothetical protein [Herbidospora mongoliensis]|uniref:hypothetical protein n=1 Tax=Herbidospora mongoliensis TaxID=688067 RepID=UPI000830D5A5|nr:hypothetical protein [Herbidospora mongoliensis]